MTTTTHNVYSGRSAALARLRDARRPVLTSHRGDPLEGLADVLPDVLDGGAYGVGETHDAAGNPTGGYHVVYVASAVAQPADPRALRLKSVQWHESAHGPIDREDGAGRIVDNGRIARESGRALMGADGCNLTLTVGGQSERARYRTLRAAGARWLHAVAGTQCPADVAQCDPQRVVGAIAVDPASTRTVYGVAVTWQGQRRGATATATRVRQDGTLTYPTDPAKQMTSAHVVSGWADNLTPQHHTARIVTLRQDRRRTAERGETYAAQQSASASKRRTVAAVRKAVAYVTNGLPDDCPHGTLPASCTQCMADHGVAPIRGRSHSAAVKLATAAILTGALTGSTPADVLAGYES